MRHIRLEQLKRAISKLVKIGVLELGDSPYCAPVFFLPKKRDSKGSAERLRLLMDFRAHNAVSVRQSFPLGDIHMLINQVVGSRHFVALDLRHAYMSISLTPEAKKKAAIIVPWGVYLCRRLTFGLSGAPSTFSRCMIKLLDGCEGAIFYMDDILIHAKTQDELFRRVLLILKRLSDNGMKIIPSKSVWFKTRLKWIGQIIDAFGRRPDTEKIEALKKLPPFTSIKSVQTWCGHLAFQAAFIPDYSRLIAPITGLIKQDKFATFQSSDEAESQRELAQRVISKRTMLYHPQFDEPMYLASDASYEAGAGWLYNVSIYEDTPEGRLKAIQDWSLEDDFVSAPKCVIPGTTPGKKCPTNLRLGAQPRILDEAAHTHIHKTELELPEEQRLDLEAVTTVDVSADMKEDTDHQNSNSPQGKTKKIKTIYIVRPISFWSKRFTTSQTSLWTTLEKETASLLQCALNYQDYLVACRNDCYMVTDAQPILWVLKAKQASSNLKMIRWSMRLLEMDLSLIISHCAGARIGTADYLSRVWAVCRQENNFDPRGPVAIHITPTFVPGFIVTLRDIQDALDADPSMVTHTVHTEPIINANDEIHLINKAPMWECIHANVQTCISKVQTIATFCSTKADINILGLDIAGIQSQLTDKEIRKEQRASESILGLIHRIQETPEKYPHFFLYQDLLFRKRRGYPNLQRNEGRRVLPRSLVPAAIALYHFRSHPGAERLSADLSSTYYWPNMAEDCQSFSAGCVLCAEEKSSNKVRPPLGIPSRNIYAPCTEWQIDMVEGMRPSDGCTRFITCVELFSRFVVAFEIPNPESKTIGEKLEKHVIVPFGAPRYFSCDRGSNLISEWMRKTMAFYGTAMKPGLRYSPWSHGLVEQFNRILQCLIRMLATQLEKKWTKVLPLATLLLNSINRPQLGNRSSHEMIFGFPPAWKNRDPIKLSKEDVLDPDQYYNIMKQRRNLCNKIVRHFQRRRAQRNANITSKEAHYPPGTLIYLRRNQSEDKHKTKPRYFRAPSMVVREYLTSVVHKTLAGVVMKDHKRNIKVCGPRTREFYGNLPPKLKILCGGEFSDKIWAEHQNELTIPDFLFEKEHYVEPVANRTRTFDDIHAGRVDPDEPQLAEGFVMPEDTDECLDTADIDFDNDNDLDYDEQGETEIVVPELVPPPPTLPLISPSLIRKSPTIVNTEPVTTLEAEPVTLTTKPDINMQPVVMIPRLILPKSNKVVTSIEPSNRPKRKVTFKTHEKDFKYSK